MSGMVMRNVSVVGSALRLACLRGVIMEGCSFSGVWRGSQTEGRTVGTDLTEARLDEASIKKTDFTGVNVSRICCRGAKLSSVVFDRAIGDKSDFGQAQLNDVSFRDTVLTGAVFSGATMCSADFSGADLRNAVFEASSIAKATFTKAKYNAKTRWPSGFDPARAGAVLVREEK